ncbi:MAG: hypothetical protein NBV65_12035 [Burkholderiaceae bacterium]|nr:hypothetical protein [Burkholderiaceae bacterium]
MFNKIFGRTNPPASAPPADTLILKNSVRLSGFKLVFTSKLTTNPAGLARHAHKSVLFGDMRAQAAKAVKGMISELKLTKSKHDVVRHMAEMTLDNIRSRKAASRGEIDQLFLVASLLPDDGNPEDLVCEPGPVESYARRRAQVCLAQKLGLAPAVRERYTSALLDYAGARQVTLDKANQGARTTESLELNLSLRSLEKVLATTVPALPDNDASKPLLNNLLASLQKDVGKLTQLPHR